MPMLDISADATGWSLVPVAGGEEELYLLTFLSGVLEVQADIGPADLAGIAAALEAEAGPPVRGGRPGTRPGGPAGPGRGQDGPRRARTRSAGRAISAGDTPRVEAQGAGTASAGTADLGGGLRMGHLPAGRGALHPRPVRPARGAVFRGAKRVSALGAGARRPPGRAGGRGRRGAIRGVRCPGAPAGDAEPPPARRGLGPGRDGPSGAILSRDGRAGTSRSAPSRRAAIDAAATRPAKPAAHATTSPPGVRITSPPPRRGARSRIRGGTEGRWCEG